MIKKNVSDSNVLHPMERVGILIDKLKEQFEHQAGSDELLVTVRNLYAAIQSSKQATLPFEESPQPTNPAAQSSQLPMTQVERPSKELNDTMSVAHKNLNDLHRTGQPEMAEAFREQPIQDLKKPLALMTDTSSSTNCSGVMRPCSKEV